jgi:ABC-type multidrug transport system fused ATPase/permease subunit
MIKTYLLPRWPSALLLLFILLLGVGLELLSPFILARFIDGALAGEPLRELFGLAVIFLLLASLIQLGNVAESYLATDLGFRTTNDLRADLALPCLTLDMSFHNSRTPGELIDRVDGDVGNLSHFFARFVVDLLGSAFLLLGVLVVLYSIDWRVGAALSGFVGVMLVAAFALRNVGVPYFMVHSEAHAKFFGFLEERLNGTEDVRPNGAVPYVMRRFFEHGRSLFRKGFTANIVGMSVYSLSMILFAGGSVVSLGLGTFLFQGGLITLGTVYMMFRYTELLTRPIETIGRQLEQLQQAGASIMRVQELLDTRTRLEDDGKNQLASGALSVAFEKVSFHYPDAAEDDAKPVLEALSFSLQAGKKLGLLGRTGSGKTTLTRLLFRFFDPVAGTVYLNNTPLPDYALSSLRECVAMVTQEIQLFHASVRDNLTLFKKEISDEKILQAIREVGLWEWFTALKDGLDTRLEPASTGLSAGQAQLLAFARVFLKDPGLVILDEASSRLDPATEQQLEQAIEKLLRGRTAIIIAHRLKTIDRVDELMILEDGHCIEYGKKTTLEKTNSRFAELLKTGLDEALV